MEIALAAVACAGFRQFSSYDHYSIPSLMACGLGILLFAFGLCGAIGGFWDRSFKGFAIGCLAGIGAGAVVILFMFPMPRQTILY